MTTSVPVVPVWTADTGADLANTNVNGVVNALVEQRRGRYWLQTMCAGGGMANAAAIEQLG
jgi:acetyl-CoA acyltransferase